MQFVEAFNSIGYDVPSPRQDWSAEKADGICISLWRAEVIWIPPPPRFDLNNHGTPGTTEWEKLPGHNKRLRHLQRAISQFDRWVDVVVVTGVPGESYGTAHAWHPSQRAQHKWRIQFLDEATGWFSAAAEKLE